MRKVQISLVIFMIRQEVMRSLKRSAGFQRLVKIREEGRLWLKNRSKERSDRRSHCVNSPLGRYGDVVNRFASEAQEDKTIV